MKLWFSPRTTDNRVVNAIKSFKKFFDLLRCLWTAFSWLPFDAASEYSFKLIFSWILRYRNFSTMITRICNTNARSLSSHVTHFQETNEHLLFCCCFLMDRCQINSFHRLYKNSIYSLNNYRKIITLLKTYHKHANFSLHSMLVVISRINIWIKAMFGKWQTS